MKQSKSDVSKFATLMRIFEVNCSVPKITKDQLNLYFKTLKQFTINEIETAFQKVLLSWEYNKLPTIGVFIKALEKEHPLIGDMAEIQATEVLKQMQVCGGYGTPEFTDPVTIELMKHRFSFIGLCRTMKEGEEKWFVKEFIQAYQAFDRNKKDLLIEAPEKLKKITDSMFERIE